MLLLPRVSRRQKNQRKEEKTVTHTFFFFLGFFFLVLGLVVAIVLCCGEWDHTVVAFLFYHSRLHPSLLLQVVVLSSFTRPQLGRLGRLDIYKLLCCVCVGGRE